MTSAMAFDLTETATISASKLEQLTFRQFDVAGLRAIGAKEWGDLAAAALVENPFYDRGHVLAGLDNMDQGKKVRGYSFTTASGQMVGLFLTQPRSIVPSPFPVANSLANIYQFSGTPLVHRDHAEQVIEAWVNGLSKGKLPAIWSFADFDTASPLAEMMRQAAQARGLHWQVVVPYERAHLSRLPDGFEAHLQEVLSKSRLHDVRRTMRRLGEAGSFSLEHVQDGPQFAQRLEDFLQLEHSGWKGAQGTSFLSHAKDTAFARAAYRPGFSALDSLLFEGKPIAMKLAIRTGRTAFTPKIAYDESFKKLGPGMALEYLLLQEFYNSDGLDAIDSASTAEGHSALNFFNNRKAMGTVLVGRRQWQVKLLAVLYEGRKALKGKVKSWQAQWNARRTRPAATKASGTK